MSNIAFKGSRVHTRKEFPKVGIKAKDFRLVGKDLSDVTLNDFHGKKKVLSVVPSLDTSVCSTMTKHFNDAAKSHPDVVFLVVSCDLPFAQTKFCGAEGVENIVALSVMRDRSFAEDYGVLIEDGPLEGICARAVFVIDEKDQIIYAELVPEITQEPNYDGALKVL